MIRDYFFHNTTGEIYPLLNEVVLDIGRYSRGGLPASKISACKQLVIELLTNGVKHSGTRLSLITIKFNSSSIVISKLDGGNVFRLNEHQEWPLSDFKEGERTVIYNCDFYALSAVIQSENQLSFEVEEYPVEDVHSSSSIPEHYGLLILTKLSSVFTYEYDSNKKINKFSATVNLDN